MSAQSFPFPVLIGDIGGTNARFALVPDPTSEMTTFPITQTAEWKTIDDAIDSDVISRGHRPKTAMLALAGPITGDHVRLTNCDWIVEPKRLIARFGLAEAALLNDFEALSLALPGLQAADLDPIGSGSATAEGARVVLGPGTGLGAGALIHSQGSWIPVPSEGGHIDLGPVTARDFAIWPHLERVGGRISAEALLSGPGLLRLYHAVAASDGRRASLSTPADVTAAGLAGSDDSAAEALALFATYLGRFAGDLAMIFMARGGVYLAGGIPSKIAPVLKAGGFREAFEAKAPHAALLAGFSTAIIVKTFPALAGLAAYARAPSRFGVELDGRRWRS